MCEEFFVVIEVRWRWDYMIEVRWLCDHIKGGGLEQTRSKCLVGKGGVSSTVTILEGTPRTLSA